MEIRTEIVQQAVGLIDPRRNRGGVGARGADGENRVCACAPPSTDPQFTASDAADLFLFFSREPPVVPGLASAFGAACAAKARQAHAGKAVSAAMPTPFVVCPGGGTIGAAWTEIVACPAGDTGCGANDTEDDLIAYVDARRRSARVLHALEALSRDDQEVLATRYSAGFDGVTSVAALTATARTETQLRGQASELATVHTLERLAIDAAESSLTRDHARAALCRIQREATSLLDHAHAHYAHARRSIAR